MRLLLKYRTGGLDHPDGDISRDQVSKIIETLGWSPKDSPFAQGQLKATLDKLPNNLQGEVLAGEPILINPRPSLWGIVSTENHNLIYIRLFQTDLQTLRDVADTVVSEFPRAFERAVGRDLGFDPVVAIRRFDNEDRMVVGNIEEAHTARYTQYARVVRRREYILICVLGFLTLGTLAGSVAIFLAHHSATLDYWRGYLDRGATTFATAALTTLINLYFEFRNWRNDKRRVIWAH